MSNPLRCMYCGASFLSAQRLETHHLRVHFMPTYRCLICRIQFYNGSDLLIHEHYHHQRR